MMFNEFKQKVREFGGDVDITDDDYRIIETVYTFHPSIPDDNGKGVIAKLFLIGGMPLMRDMYIRASRIEKHKKEIIKQENVLARMKDLLKSLKEDELLI